MAIPQGFLRGAVGAGLENKANDVIGVKQRLRNLGLYNPPPEGIGDDIDAEFENAVRAFQESAGLRVDGFLEPGGETERNLTAYSSGEGFEPPPKANELILSGKVGAGGDNDLRDVTVIKRALGAIEAYPYDRTRPPPPYIDRKLVDAIRSFQRSRGLYDDGLIATDGETLPALRDALATSSDTESAQDKSSNKRPAEIEVAAVAALPWLFQAGRAAAQYGPKIIGGITGGAAAQKAIDATRELGSKYEAAPPPPPIPPSSGDPFEPPEHEEFPAEPPKIPEDTSFPKPIDPRDLIEIFPDRSGEFSLPIVHESRGEGLTLVQNDALRALLEKLAARRGRSAVHTGGTTDKDGNNKTETWMPNYATGGRKGSSRVDITFTSERTGRRLFINTTDTLADRVTPSKRERDASVRFVLNGESGDMLVLIGKIREGEALDTDSLEKLLDPLLDEIDRPAKELDHRRSDEIQKRIHLFRPKLPPTPRSLAP